MNKTYLLRICLAIVVAVLSILGILGVFYPFKIFDVQVAALLQRVLVDFSLFAGILLLGIIVLTLLFGRVYCSVLCPLGLLQEGFALIFRRKNVALKNWSYKYFIAAIVFGAMLGGTVYLVRLIDPYSVFGSAFSGAVWGLVFAAGIALLVWFKGRYFCSNICPVGAVLGLLSKNALMQVYIDDEKCVACGRCASKCPSGSIDFKNKIVDNETCVKCFRCLNGCPKNAIYYGKKPDTKVSFNPERRRFILGGAALVVLALAVKSGVEISKKVATKLKKVILPAGAGNADDFANRCLNCNLCVQNCPMKIIKKADGEYPAVHIDYQDSFCDYNCHKCSEVCPSGAIKRLTLAEKQKTQIALAEIDENICIKCGLCVMKCPAQAISRADGAFPIVDANKCIGCGTCQTACPVKAIKVVGVEAQKLL